jgi:hypothetical protein
VTPLSEMRGKEKMDIAVIKQYKNGFNYWLLSKNLKIYALFQDWILNIWKAIEKANVRCVWMINTD